MIALHAALHQRLATAELPAAVRAVLGKPLRRAAPLTQLALVGALACLPAERRAQPTALLWQSTSGPRQETGVLLDEICAGAAEPMPYDFLATQPAIAAAHLQPALPGLRSATHFPLETPGAAEWSLLLALAINWLTEGRYDQVLCAHLDIPDAAASGHWLCLAREPLENSPVGLQMDDESAPDAVPDTPDFPEKLAIWRENRGSSALHLQSTAMPRLAVKFSRLPFFRP